MKKNIIDFEKRNFICEFRAKNDNDKFIVDGRAIPYDNESSDGSLGFVEIIKRSALEKIIKNNDDVYMFWSHNMDIPIARTANDTLRLIDKPDGLYFEADLSSTQQSRDAHDMIKKGLVTNMSFGFTIGKDKWYKRDGLVYREIIEIRTLYEISPVAIPAFNSTTVEARSMFSKLNASEQDTYELHKLNLQLDTDIIGGVYEK